MHNKKRILLLGALFLSPILGWASSNNNSSLNQLRSPISLSGTIQPAETVKVQSSVSGRVTQVLVSENQQIQSNQLLLTVKNDVQKRQLTLAQLQVSISELNVKDRERQLELSQAQIEVNRNNLEDAKKQTELSKFQIEINQNNYQDAQQQSELSKIQIEVNSNNIKDLETNIKDINRRLKDEKALLEQGSSTRSQMDAIQLQSDRAKFSLANSKLTLKRSKQDQERVKFSLANSKLALKRSQQDLERTQLREKTSQLTLDRSKVDLLRTKLAIENAKLTLERAKQDVELKQVSLNDTQVHAPTGGIITNQFAEVGEVINAGVVLYQIIKMDEIQIELQVEEEDLPFVQIGEEIVFTTPGYRNQQFKGKIDSIEWAANAQTGRFPVIVKAENPDMKLRAGMSAKVFMLVD